MDNSTVNYPLLRDAVLRRKSDTRTSFHKIAEATQVRNSTLCRFVKTAHKLSFAQSARLAEWAGLPMEVFIPTQKPDTLSAISGQVMNDDNLSLDAKDALFNLFRIAYEQKVAKNESLAQAA